MNYQGDLKINVFAQDDQIIVEISDSGSGIPVDIQEKIFEPFLQQSQQEKVVDSVYISFARLLKNIREQLKLLAK
jgi:K+-sensing histidine kinase KdpD